MTNQDPCPAHPAVDALVAQLLACGGALSQIISHMSEFEASGLSSPDAPPIIDVAHSLIRDVIRDLPERHSEDEIQASAEIVEQVTTAICENIFFVPPTEIRRSLNGASSRTSRNRRRSGRRKR
jgi:hypothetical protein